MMHRETRDWYGSHEHEYRHQHSRNGAHDERRRDYKSRWSKKGARAYNDDREQIPLKPRFNHSRSRSPSYRCEAGMGGLIFMCNKKTQRRCLDFEVLGMPMAKKKLADQIVPGMPLFLFEFESRDLYGVYEAASRVGMDLEPKAFVEAEIDFPLQVRFRVRHKCPPLREAQYRDAIRENYFEANRFKFVLSNDQVSSLVRLFVSADSSDRGNTSRNLQYQYLTAPPYDDAEAEYRGLTTTSSRSFQGNDDRRVRDEHWRKDSTIYPRATYIDSSATDDYKNEDHWRRESELFSKASYVDAHRGVEYTPDYKQSRYYSSSTVKPGYQRYDSAAAAWPTSGYEYSSGLEPVHSSIASVYPSQASYVALPAKYDTVSGYAVGIPEVVALPTEAGHGHGRYWKSEENSVQLAPEAAYVKAAMYSRQAYPIYADAGNGENAYRLPSRKMMIPEAEYVSSQQLAPVPVTYVQEAGDYWGFNSSLRKPSFHGYPDPGLSSTGNRYPSSRALAPEENYSLEGEQFRREQSPRPGVAPERERFRREESPRPSLVPETRYIPPAAAAARHVAPEREARFAAPELESGAYDRREARYASEAPASRFASEVPEGGGYDREARFASEAPKVGEYDRDVEGQETGLYEQQGYRAKQAHRSPVRRGFQHRKVSVWDRVSGVGRSHKMHYHHHHNHHHQQQQHQFRKRREYSPGFVGNEINDDDSSELPGGEESGEEDESFVVDFKRRNKGSLLSEDVSREDEARPRKKRIVRPV